MRREFIRTGVFTIRKCDECISAAYAFLWRALIGAGLGEGLWYNVGFIYPTEIRELIFRRTARKHEKRWFSGIKDKFWTKLGITDIKDETRTSPLGSSAGPSIPAGQAALHSADDI